uniref:Ubiquitin-like protease family profile domain-containing protein n=1 Tax=Timema tahoe TaxID=61484 RepID=A0A7R9NW77_9NEOP|nr:unnamed protein product [Timema tahoe]
MSSESPYNAHVQLCIEGWKWNRSYLIETLSPELREKIHIMGTYFYNKLTQRRAAHVFPEETDALLTPAERRHCRVKGWTKKVDLFTKDFIFIPINEISQEKNRKFSASLCRPRSPTRGDAIMIWGCITSKRPGECKVMYYVMDIDKYSEHIQEIVNPLEQMIPKEISTSRNASRQRSKATRTWFDS